LLVEESTERKACGGKKERMPKGSISSSEKRLRACAKKKNGEKVRPAQGKKSNISERKKS